MLGNPTEREVAVLKLLAKHGLSGRVQLVVLAYESGLVQPGPIR